MHRALRFVLSFRAERTKKGPPDNRQTAPEISRRTDLELRTGSYQRLALFVSGELREVLDEAAGQILRLLVPLCGVGVGIARIEDGAVHARQSGGHLEVEDRNLLRGSLVDRAVQDGVDDTAGILD